MDSIITYIWIAIVILLGILVFLISDICYHDTRNNKFYIIKNSSIVVIVIGLIAIIFKLIMLLI